jgi:hypothetical protein
MFKKAAKRCTLRRTKPAKNDQWPKFKEESYKKDRETSSEKFPKHDISQNQQTVPPPTLPCSRDTKFEN